ncbi:MAG TPA: hypothetical protein VIV60_34015, partial [Polyangiaceae bacterium]
MDLEQRLNQLETEYDWYGLVSALEEAVAVASDSSLKASLHLRLGRVLNSKFIQGVRALKHFQDAYKLNPTLVEALVEARAIYWEIGKLNMVQKLLELQLKGTTVAHVVASLSQQLGDVLYDQDQAERAHQAYARALEYSGNADSDLADLVADLSVTATTWQDRIASVLRAAHAESNSGNKGRLFLRAARLARRFAPDEAESILNQGYASDYRNSATTTLLENLLVESQRTDVILQLQQSIAASAANEQQRLSALMHFGTRWALRHQNAEVAALFFRDVLLRDPTQVAAIVYLRDQSNGNQPYLTELLDLVDRGVDAAPSASAPSIAGLHAIVGLIAWRDLGDVSRARRYFTRAARAFPSQSVIQAFVVDQGPLTEPSSAATNALPLQTARVEVVSSAVAAPAPSSPSVTSARSEPPLARSAPPP